MRQNGDFGGIWGRYGVEWGPGGGYGAEWGAERGFGAALDPPLPPPPQVVIDKHPVRFFVHKRPHVDFFLEVVSAP